MMIQKGSDITHPVHRDEIIPVAGGTMTGEQWAAKERDRMTSKGWKCHVAELPGDVLVVRKGDDPKQIDKTSAIA
jgi:hypothetical protein